MDIVRIVKIHESTLRKRLIEFGDTPSSMLTLDEFMAVDLEAEQDPPAFKAARKRDKERLQKLPDHEAEFTDLQREIDNYLDMETRKRSSRKRRNEVSESEETDKFIRNSTLEVINECLVDDPDDVDAEGSNRGIAPDIAAMCAPATIEYPKNEVESEVVHPDSGELDIDGLDDAEIDGYIMTEDESKYKDEMWNKLNADYLKEARAKEERLQRERDEGKPEKKKRRVNRVKKIGPSNTAGEAIEKMLQEKKISSKINYDILKTLTETTNEEANKSAANEETTQPVSDEAAASDATTSITNEPSTSSTISDTKYVLRSPTFSRNPTNSLFPFLLQRYKTKTIWIYCITATESSSRRTSSCRTTSDQDWCRHRRRGERYVCITAFHNFLFIDLISISLSPNAEDVEDFEEEPEQPEVEADSLADMLNNGADDDYYGYDDAY